MKCQNLDEFSFSNWRNYFSCSSFFSHEQHRKIQFYFKQSRFRQVKFLWSAYLICTI
jgi:hypothetical protein